MNRRALLGALGATAGGLAGCLGQPGGEAVPGTDAATATETASLTPTDTPTPDPDLPLAQRGRPADICTLSVRRIGIEAIVGPRFDSDWSAYDTVAYGGDLQPDWTVVGVERDGRARAYPVRVLWEHEIVNDDFGGPLLVTYCSLCYSGMVAERVVDGAPTTFGVSGLLWIPPGAETRQSRREQRVFGADLEERDGRVIAERARNLVMYDTATGSYWSQLLAEGICGEHTGTRLDIVPSTATTWGEWKDAHPDTDVLVPPPFSAARNPPSPTVPTG